MKPSMRGWVEQRAWLPGLGVCLLSAASLADAGIAGGDLLARMQAAAGAGELDVLGVVVANTTDGSSTLTVSGQTVRLKAGTQVLTESGSSVASLPVNGALVAVYGSLNSDGTISASQIRVIADAYTPGATPLFVRGVVTATNAAVATAKVGALAVDYSSSLYDSAASAIKVNSVAEFTGIQTGGSSSTLYASKVTVSPSGIAGGDKALAPSGIAGGDKALTPSGIAGGDKALTASGIAGGDKALTASGIAGGDKALAPSGIAGGDKALAPSGIAGGDKALAPSGIAGGDKALAPSGIAGGDKALTPSGIAGGDKALTASGIAGGDKALTPSGIAGGDKALTASGIAGGD